MEEKKLNKKMAALRYRQDVLAEVKKYAAILGIGQAEVFERSFLIARGKLLDAQALSFSAKAETIRTFRRQVDKAKQD